MLLGGATYRHGREGRMRMAGPAEATYGCSVSSLVAECKTAREVQ